jgi:hypothetical protein
MEVSGQLHKSTTLPPGKNTSYTLARGLGEPQSRSEHGTKEKNSQFLQRLEPPIIQPVAQRYTIQLSWGFIPKCLNWFIVLEVSSESEQARG